MPHSLLPVVSGSEDKRSLEDLKVSLKNKVSLVAVIRNLCAIKSFYRSNIGSREIARYEVINYRISDHIYSHF
jgi:hypothetical protein